MPKSKSKTKKRSRSRSRVQPSPKLYDNADERAQRTAATTAMNWATKRRAMAAVVVIGAAAGIAVLVWYFNRDVNSTNSPEAQTGMDALGMRLDKQKQCYQDDDCPDNTYCDRFGYCIPAEMQQPPDDAGSDPEPVLGRGRAGEGSNVSVTTPNQRGQY